MKNNKKILLSILSIIVLPFITACSNNNDQNTSQKMSTNNDQNISNSNNNSDVIGAVDFSTDPPQELAISSACIGCGKCTKIDPAHFDMNGNKAIVASQDNLDVTKIEQAINSCPANAISMG